VAADLRPIYPAPTAGEAASQLDGFEEKPAGKYPSIAPVWRCAWAEVDPFFAFIGFSLRLIPRINRFTIQLRKTIYTIIAVEPFNWVLRTTLKTKCFFPIEDAVTKLISPAISNFEKSGRAVCEYVEARKSA
jgi:putative transposase